NGISCHLRIIGKPSHEQITFLQENAVDYSSVSSISAKQVANEYRNADIVIFASTYEGFGLPILEAQATGRPLVTSNISPMNCVAGNEAVLVDPFDVNSIRSGVVRLIENTAFRNQVVKAGLHNVERYRPNLIAQQYISLYQE